MNHDGATALCIGADTSGQILPENHPGPYQSEEFNRLWKIGFCIGPYLKSMAKETDKELAA